MKLKKRPTVTTTCMNLACYLSSSLCPLMQVEIVKPGTRKYILKMTFVFEYIRKVKKEYDKSNCYITPKNLAKLMKRIQEICDSKTRKYFQHPLAVKPLVVKPLAIGSRAIEGGGK
jgi:hypothetical protein